MYHALDWKGALRRLTHALGGADRAVEALLKRGLERWASEGRVTPSELAALRVSLSSSEVRSALHHMGVHLVLSVVIAIPIPGIRSAARVGWTLAFWIKYQIRRLFGRGVAAQAVPNIHTPLVMFLAILPVVGGAAYLASRPLRRKLLIRLVLDQLAWTLPLSLYRRLRLGGLLAPSPKHVDLRVSPRPR